MDCSCIGYCVNCSQLLVALVIVVMLNISMNIGQKVGTYFIADIREACRCHSSKCSYLQTPESFLLPPIEYKAGAGYLKLSRDPYEQGMWCAFTILAPSSMTIVARLNKYSYNYSFPTKLSNNKSSTLQRTQSSEMLADKSKTLSTFSDPPFGGCRESLLQFYDGGSVYDDSKRLAEICNSAPRSLNNNAVFRSKSNELTLNFYQLTNGPETVMFSITFTYVANRTEGCLSTEFSCKSQLGCISSKLVCDSIENCPDGSDEAMDYQRCTEWTQPIHLYKPKAPSAYSINPVAVRTHAKILLGVGSAVFFGVFLFIIMVKVKRGDNLENRGQSSRQWDRCDVNEQRRLCRSYERRPSRLTVNVINSNGGQSFHCDTFREAIDDSFVLDSEETDDNRRGHEDYLPPPSAPEAAVSETVPSASRSSATGLGLEPSAPPPEYNLLFPETASRVRDVERNSLPSYSELDEYFYSNR